jgi:hypothetical protein
MDSYGIVSHDNFAGARQGFLFQRFLAAAELASGCDVAVADAPSRPPREPSERPHKIHCPDPSARGAATDMFPAPDAGSVPLMLNFMRSAYALIYSDCINYFAVMGRNQSRSRIIRDTVGPIGTLITGILSLRGVDVGAESDAITAVTLGTLTLNSGLDIFDQNFLFGADNIDAVRQLIMNALAEHANSTLTANPVPSTFEQASINILDNQAICRPSAILRLTRTAIQNGNVQPTRTTTAPSPTSPPAPAGAPAAAPAQPATSQGLSSTSVDVGVPK